MGTYLRLSTAGEVVRLALEHVAGVFGSRLLRVGLKCGGSLVGEALEEGQSSRR